MASVVGLVDPEVLKKKLSVEVVGWREGLRVRPWEEMEGMMGQAGKA